MQARLVIIRGEGTPPVVDLDTNAPMTLGRSRENAFVLHDEHASRLHAKIYHQDGLWFIRDCDARNRTYVNAVPLQQGGEAVLVDGHEIGIGGVRLRFLTVSNGTTWVRPAFPDAPPVEADEDSGLTTLEHDELAALHEFMSAALKQTDPGALVAKALATVVRHTRATFAGFLSLDKEAPLLRLVHPENAEVDWSLSRQLTERVRDGKAVWLKAGVEGLDESESLMPFQDAMCLPLLAEDGPLGALHLYKSGGCFREQHVRFCELVAGYTASHLGHLRLCRSLKAENSWLRGHAPVSEEIIGSSPALHTLHQVIGKVGACRSTALIQGETGSGKELVALALHRQSQRRKGPLVVANCGAIPAQLLESELFGHEKGAFTDATCAREGLFEQADHGTLFLDEIGDMSLDCQVKMLRVLEGKGFRRVGGTKEIKTDVRVIAATHKDLAQEVQKKCFREDLYYRLRVVVVKVPPLREHREDIPALVDHFLDTFAADCGRRKQLSPAAMQHLQSQTWPGNVRELRTVIENAVIMSDGDTIELCDLHPQSTHHTVQSPGTLNLEQLEKCAIRQALQQTEGNVSQAAKLLGIVRETLANKIKKYGFGREE